MDRRCFIKTASVSGLGFILGCKGDPPTGSGGNGGSGSGSGSGSGGTGSGGSSGSATSWSNYIPSVNDEPYFRPDYSLAKKVASSTGEIFFEDPSENKSYLHFFSESASRDMSGLEVTLHKEYRTGRDTGLLFAQDPKGRFMSTLVSLEKAARYIKIYDIKDAEFKYNTVLGTSSKGRKITSSQLPSANLFIEELIGPLPSYDTQDMKDLPGYLYMGDWSFDELKNLNTVLKYGSLTLMVADAFGASGAGTTVAFKGYSLFSTTGEILNMIDGTVDGINLVSRVKDGHNLIGRDLEYSIYGSVDGSPRLVLFPSLMQGRDAEQDIRDFFPLTKGNSYTFTDGSQSGTAKVLGMKKIKGKDLVAVQDFGGIESYFGFEGNSLFQYGVSHPAVGNIFFDPAIKIGDNQVSVGSKYHTTSKIIFEKHTDFSGTAVEDIEWDARQNVLLSNSVPYGDCFRMRDSGSVSISAGGETASERLSVTNWFAKFLGKVKMESGGQTVELVNTTINSRIQGFELFKPVALASSQNVDFPNFSQKVVEAFRRIK